MITRSGNGIEIGGKRRNSGTEIEIENEVSDNETAYCGICKHSLDVNVAMSCDGFCKSLFHPECVDIDNDSFCAISEVMDYVKWFCKQCENKMDMLLNKLSKLDMGWDWPTILNVVLDQLELQSQSNLDLSKRMDILSDQYHNVSGKLADISSKYDMLVETGTRPRPIVKNKTDLASSTELSEFDLTVVGNLPTPGEGHRPSEQQGNTTKLLYSNVLCDQLNKPTSSITGPKSQLPTGNNSNITHSRVITNSSRGLVGSKSKDTTLVDNRDMVEDDFEVYHSRKRKSAMRRKQGNFNNREPARVSSVARPILGKRSGGDTKLKAASRRSWIFVSRVDASVTKDGVESFLKESQVDDFVCYELETKYDTYRSFKIGVNEVMFEKILDPEFWDEGILVKEFVPPRKQQNKKDFLGYRRG